MTPWLVGLLGLAVGFLAGIACDDALDMWRDSRRGRSRHTKGNPMRRPGFDTVIRTALVLIVVVNVFLGILLIQQRASSSDFTECVATYQRDFGRAYAARSDAANETSAALDRLVLAVAAEDRAKFRRALAAYVEQRERQDRERTGNPLPPLPTKLCGDPS